MKIAFKGAAGTVTGSKHLIESEEGLRILLDCGMYQGREADAGRRNRDLGFDPASVDVVFLSHAHIDHSGLLPLLVKQGFSGPIYCTEPTMALCEIMLADSAHIQMSDFKYESKHVHGELAEPLYDVDDVRKAMDLFRPLTYDEWHDLGENLTAMFTYVGHILGSACVNLRIREGRKTHRVAYTGDIGRRDQKIIRGPEPFPRADVIITESTYGDRLHASVDHDRHTLGRIVQETCVDNKGKLIIPSFSLGRTQEIVYALDRLESEGELPPIKVFVDSPLSTNATEIVRSFPDHYNERMLKYMERDKEPFGFSNLHYIREAKYSKLINSLREPAIIISASGMAEAGRIVHHLKNNLEDPRNTVLIVGYCEPSTLGGQLREGAESVRIHGREYTVKARVEVLDSYSAHGDYSEMMEYLSCQEPHLITHLFLVHGRPEVREAYRDHLEAGGFHHIHLPEEGEVVEIKS